MLRELTLTAIAVLFALSVFAQGTLWQGTVDTDWNNPANWSNGVPTTGYTATILGAASNFPTYAGSPIVDFTIENFGTLTFTGFIYNTGNIVNFSGADMSNDGFFVNTGTVTFNNDGDFTNGGTFENYGIFDNANVASLDNLAGAAYVNYGTIQNFGPVTNSGTFENFGTILSTDEVINSGDFVNYGIFQSEQGSNLVNNAGGTFSTEANSIFFVNSTFTNAGTLTNKGDMTFASAAVIDNTGSITNQNRLTNSGELTNDNSLTNNGVFFNKNEADLINNQVLNNFGIIDNDFCGRITHTANNTINASIRNDGTIYNVGGGTVNFTADELSFVTTDINAAKPPVPGCTANRVFILGDNNSITVDALDVDKGSYAQCGATLVSQTINPSVFTQAGVFETTLRIEDNFGNVETCVSTITILDEPVAPPTGITPVDNSFITSNCPADQTLQTLPGELTTPIFYIIPSASSSCSGNASNEVIIDETPTTVTDNCNIFAFSIQGWIYMGTYQGSKYYCSEANYTWGNAKIAAETAGGHLAVIESAGENNFIQSNLIGDSGWIGVTDELAEGSFKTLFGLSPYYTNWNFNEPNNLNGTEHYVRMLKLNGAWTDRDANWLSEAVMEIPCTVTISGGACENNLITENPGFEIGTSTWSRWGSTSVTYSDNALNYTLRTNNGATGGAGSSLYPVTGGSVYAHTGYAKISASPELPSWAGIGITYYDNNNVRLLEEFEEITATSWDYYSFASKAPANATKGRVFFWKSGSSGKLYIDDVCFSEISGNGDPASDVQCEDVIVERVAGPEPGGLGFGGTNQIAYKFTDCCGNEEICVFEVEVEVTPVTIDINCPSDINVDAAVCDNNATASWVEPTATSDCFEGGVVTITRTDDGPSNGGTFTEGFTTIVYEIVDECGNTEFCVFNVIVNSPAGVLTFNCPSDYSTNLAAGQTSGIVSWPVPTASTTGFDGVTEVRQVQGPDNGTNIAAGTYSIIYFINDNCGNSEVCVFNVTVNEGDPLCEVNGGALNGGPFTFCANDGTPDNIPTNGITLTSEMGTNTQWVVTDDQGNILGLPPTFSAVDFDGAGAGTCLVWHLSFEDGLEGAEAGLNANDLVGCFSLSNPITVNRVTTGGPCAAPDADGDGTPDADDCSPNNASLPAAVGSVCNDSNPNTINDEIQADGCTCEGTPNNTGGSDPTVCDAAYTVDGNSITITGLDEPIVTVKILNSDWSDYEFVCDTWATVGTCNASETVNNIPAGDYIVFIQSFDAGWNPICAVTETFTISGDGNGGGTGTVDSDGDGTPDADDCAPNNASLPAAPGSACNDGNASTTNDQILADGCTCEGTPDNGGGNGGGDPTVCDAAYTVDGNSITITGLDEPITTVKILNADWSDYEFVCDTWATVGTCNVSETVNNIPAGDYIVFIQSFDAGWNPICAVTETFTISGSGNGGGSSTIDSDGDGTPDADDCAPTNASSPAAPGTSCNDFDANTTNDVIGADGCSCAGTPVNANGCNVTYTASTSSITVGGLTDPIVSVKILDLNWNTLEECGTWVTACGTSQTFSGLTAGQYYLSVQTFDAGWTEQCNIFETVEVGVAPMIASDDLRFDVHSVARRAELSWITNTEVKNDFFIIERSADGETFEAITEVQKLSNGDDANFYSINDENPNLGDNFYRVKQVYVDGTFEYSETEYVAFNIDLANFDVYPNPANNRLFVNLSEYVGQNGTIEIFNSFGQPVNRFELGQINNESFRIDVSDYKNGVYTITVKVADRQFNTKMFVVSKL